MNKNACIILFVCMAMLLAGCVTHGETTPTSGETITPETQEQTQPTTEEIPGVEDSIFDDPQWIESAGNAVEETQPENEKPAETTPVETTTPYEESKPTDSEGDSATGEMTYEKYNAMSGNEQMEFFSTFASVEDFVDWYNSAKEKYEAEHPYIEIENGEIDLDAIFGTGN